MGLSNDLISQFVKVTNDTTKEKKETTVYGTVFKQDGIEYVKIDGSDRLTPVSSTTAIDNGERVTVLIKDHTAMVTGNISSPSARTTDVDAIGSQISEFEIVIADKVSTKELEVEKGRIDNLTATNVTINNKLTAAEANISNLTADNVSIKKTLTANEAKISNLTATKLDAEIANITYASIEDLEAINADVYNLEATYAEIDKALIKKANIVDLEAIEGDIENLKSITGNITDLTASNIDFETANGGVLDVQTLLSQFTTGENAQYLNITNQNATIGNAVIKNAMIDTVAVDKLSSGTINTNEINLVSDDNSLNISDGTIQFKDTSGKVRLQLGEDTSGDFNFILKGSDGSTTLIDSTGIKEKAIADKLIKTNMINDKAVGANQLNYSSLVSGLNSDGTAELIKSSKVGIDGTNQTLSVAFNQIQNSLSGHDNSIKTNATNITAINGQITTLISDTETIEGDIKTVKNNYSTLNQTVNGINTTVGSHTTSITNLNTSVSTAQSIANSKAKVFTSTPTVPYSVGDLWVQGTNGDVMKCKVARTTGSYTSSEWEKASKYTDDTTANNVASNLATLTGRVTTTENNYSSLSQDLTSYKTTVGSTYSTKTEVNTVKNDLKTTNSNLATTNSNLTATNSNVSSLTTRVSSAETSITQLNNKIALKVESKDITNAVNNIQIGSANLIKNSNFTVTATKDNYADVNVPVVLADNTNLTERFKGNTFTFSYYVHCPGERTNGSQTNGMGNRFGIHCNISWSDSTGKLANKSEFPFASYLTGSYNNERVTTTYTFTPPTGYDTIVSLGFSFQPYAKPNSNEIWKLGQPKLEKGNKPTDWSPAPEDVYDYISTVSSEQVSQQQASLDLTAESILSTVSERYATITNTEAAINTLSTSIEQTAKDINFKFTEERSYSEGVQEELQSFKNTVEKNISFSGAGISISASNSPFASTFSNDKLSFTQDGNEVAYISSNKMFITDADIENSLAIGNFNFLPRQNGNLSIVWKEG